MKKFFITLFLNALLVNSAFADDLLAKITNGVLSDNSKGVKVLSLDEMKEVKGGYLVGFKIFKDRFSLTLEVYAILDFSDYEYENLRFLKGICGAGEKECSC